MMQLRECLVPQIIWLIGVCVVRPGQEAEYEFMWADTQAEQKANLKRLANLLGANPSFPIVTWNGRGADMPRLRRACNELELGPLFDNLKDRHRDLYHDFTKAVRLPKKKLSLSHVASWLGISRQSKIPKGRQVTSSYLEYFKCRESGNPIAESMKQDLVQYNRDDLDMLIGVVGKIPTLMERRSIAIPSLLTNHIGG